MTNPHKAKINISGYISVYKKNYENIKRLSNKEKTFIEIYNGLLIAQMQQDAGIIVDDEFLFEKIYKKLSDKFRTEKKFFDKIEIKKVKKLFLKTLRKEIKNKFMIGKKSDAFLYWWESFKYKPSLYLFRMIFYKN